MQTHLQQATFDLYSPQSYRREEVRPGTWLVTAKPPKEMDHEVTTAQSASALGLAPKTVRDICAQTDLLVWRRKTHRDHSQILITKASVIKYRNERQRRG